jgi:hypothetical protein
MYMELSIFSEAEGENKIDGDLDSGEAGRR